MPEVIQTPFDDTIDEAVQLEQPDEEILDYESLLVNAENIYKSFLYLKRVFSSAPIFNKIIKIQKFKGVDKLEVEIEKEANLVTFKNIGESNAYVTYNDNDELVLFQYESADFPYNEGDTFKISGDLNVIQVKYEYR